MGVIDIATRRMIDDSSFAAECANALLYGGEAVIRPEDVSDFSEHADFMKVIEGKEASFLSSARVADVVKLIKRREGDAIFGILSIESQSELDYAFLARHHAYISFLLLRYLEQHGRGVKVPKAYGLVMTPEYKKHTKPRFFRDYYDIEADDSKMIAYDREHMPYDFTVDVFSPAMDIGKIEKFQPRLASYLAMQKYKDDYNKLIPWLEKHGPKRLNRTLLNAVSAVTRKDFGSIIYDEEGEVEMAHMFQGLIDETMEKGEKKGAETEKNRVIHTMKQKHYSFAQVKDFYANLTEKEWDSISVSEDSPKYKV